MEMTRKRASDPNRGEYEIELPVVSLVKEALLTLDYSQGPIKIEDAAEMLSGKFSLTDREKNARHKNGFNIYKHYVANAAGALVKNGQLVRPKTGWIVKPEQVDGSSTGATIDSGNGGDTSEKSIEKNYQQIRKELAAELLQKIKDNSPIFFEELVIDLLVEMGYGGSREDAQAVGRSGDGGIDGVINEDRLGLDVIYVQAKRWENNVGEPPVRDFVGALQGKRARKGIFITTSNFSNSARKYISAIDSRDSKVILIDGHQLAQLMIDHDVGVSVEKTYEIKRVDSDYFSEDPENS